MAQQESNEPIEAAREQRVGVTSLSRQPRAKLTGSAAVSYVWGFDAT